MGFFSKLKGKSGGDTAPKKSKKGAQTNGAVPAPAPKPHWDDAWTRKEVEPEEVQELLRGCTMEMKSRALDMPFLLLPFRPASDPSAARTFIRNYFSMERGAHLKGERLEQELLLTEPMVLSSVMKWCWSRLAGGVVTWEAYELFKVGETDSDLARDAFATFIPLSVESDARTKIIFDFFDLMAAVAAHGKTNGMGGRKLSRLAGWWAFEQLEASNGFDMGYKSWASAADATSHLFFAYLRSLSPDSVRGINGISNLPLSLQTLVQETKYPPENSPYESISKVAMVVDSVSPTPFALLRRARNFHYRDDDQALQRFSDFEDPVQALTDECRRVLKSISSANQSDASTTNASTSLGDSSWSRFEDMGFGGGLSYIDEEDDSALGKKRRPAQNGPRTAPQTKTNDHGRPTTPSWADFLSSGFIEDVNNPAPRPLLLPPDKILPPIDLDLKRGKSSQSHVRPNESDLEPGELASITAMKLDDAFWWVWITSLAGEETTARKSVFGRCALVETSIGGGAWLVFEEMVKGAAPEPEVGAYVAEKKSRFTFGKKSKMSRTKSMGRSTLQPQMDPFARSKQVSPASKVSIGPDQHARIQAAAAALQQKQKQQDTVGPMNTIGSRRGRGGDAMSTKTNSVFTLQPVIMNEGAPAMKWANNYDKKEIRAAYLGNNFAGRGSDMHLTAGSDTAGSVTPQPAQITPQPPKKDTPKDTGDYGFPPGAPQQQNSRLPALPAETPRENLRTPAAPEGPAPPVPEAPLPVESEPRNLEAAEAAHVPLPAPTPIEPSSAPPPLPADGEPLEPVQTATQDETNNMPPPASSPEGKRDPKKLKKQPGQGGLRGIFGKKKVSERSAPSSAAPDSQAVAAARAAYTGPQTKSNYTSNNPNSLGRRLSGIGRKKTPPMAGSGSGQPTTEEAEPALVAPPAPYNENYSQASMTSTQHEQQTADREFQTFDQHGPVDQPAFVPEDSPRPSFVPESEVSRPSTTATEPLRPMYAPPIGKGEYEPSISDDEMANEDDTPFSPEKNRWSQIRRNAAERAGRASEDQRTETTRHTTGDTEDGEESAGEETIESRVARIKARVAELTGGMPQAGAEPTKA